MPNQVQGFGDKLRQLYNRHTPVPTQAVLTSRANHVAAGEEPFLDSHLGANPSMVAAQR